MAHGLQRVHQNDTRKSVCGRPKTFSFSFLFLRLKNFFVIGDVFF